MSPIEASILEAGDQIIASAFFGTNSIPVIVEKREFDPLTTESFEDQIAGALNDYGIVVTIPLPDSNVKFKEVPGPFQRPVVKIVVMGHDYRAVSAVTVLETCIQAQRSLNHWKATNSGVAWSMGDPGYVIRQPTNGIVRGEIEMVFGVGADTLLAQVATPTIVRVSPTNFTMACATPGAAIWYSTDGKAPGPSHGTLYVGGFTQAEPVTFKLKAWRSGLYSSEVLTQAYA